jgi:hypothetical protein
MLVKESRFFPTLKFDPDISKRRKESNHTITEAGLKNMIDRFCASWQKEKELRLTEATIQEGEVQITLPDKEVVRPCTCVTTLHQPKDRQHFRFYRTKLYFDKETGLPIRMEGFDWPKDENDKEGQLVEHYAYLELTSNVGLADVDFQW